MNLSNLMKNLVCTLFHHYIKKNLNTWHIKRFMLWKIH